MTKKSQLSTFLNSIFFSAGYEWKEIVGQQLTWISSGADGEVWGVNKDKEIVRRRGVSQSNPIGNSWEHVVGPKVTQLDVYGGQVWAVDSAQKLHHGSIICP